MADQIREVQTVDVQLLNASRERPKTYKFDNPKANLTRAMVSEAFTPALTKGWLLAADNSTAMYIGDVILNTSKKITLDGEDFYITPSSLSFSPQGSETKTVTVTGAQIQGYNIKNKVLVNTSLTVNIVENDFVANVTKNSSEYQTGSATLILVIQGQEVSIPITIP